MRNEERIPPIFAIINSFQLPDDVNEAAVKSWVCPRGYLVITANKKTRISYPEKLIIHDYSWFVTFHFLTPLVFLVACSIWFLYSLCHNLIWSLSMITRDWLSGSLIILIPTPHYPRVACLVLFVPYNARQARLSMITRDYHVTDITHQILFIMFTWLDPFAVHLSSECEARVICQLQHFWHHLWLIWKQ